MHFPSHCKMNFNFGNVKINKVLLFLTARWQSPGVTASTRTTLKIVVLKLLN